MPTTAPAATERPILFTAPLVRAILAGDKTQTRRVINPQPPTCEGETLPFDPPRWQTPAVVGADGELGPAPEDEFGISCVDGEWGRRCPYGAPGDRLWVREAFRLPALFDDYSPSEVGEQSLKAGHDSEWCPLLYEASGDTAGSQEELEHFEVPTEGWGRLRPSIHMPRWASRIELEVVDVRVQRVRETSHADARAEGVEHALGDHVDLVPDYTGSVHQHGFAQLWNRINASRGYGWDANPWVWVVEFHRVTP